MHLVNANIKNGNISSNSNIIGLDNRLQSLRNMDSDDDCEEDNETNSTGEGMIESNDKKFSAVQILILFLVA